MRDGHCKGYQPRFYFNGVECVPFIYGGCGGNGNNFGTLKNCQIRCFTKGLIGKGPKLFTIVFSICSFLTTIGLINLNTSLKHDEILSNLGKRQT